MFFLSLFAQYEVINFAQGLRAIIAFGIMALVGIITAIKAMNQKFTESFSTMGANGFTIRFKERQIHFGGGGESDLKLAKKGKQKGKEIKSRQTDHNRRGGSI